MNEIKTVPSVPFSHPFVERLVGTVRQDYLDQTLYWNVRNLEQKPDSFQEYYNRYRVHRGFKVRGQVPDPKADSENQPVARLDDCRWKSHCRGLFQLPMAA